MSALNPSLNSAPNPRADEDECGACGVPCAGHYTAIHGDIWYVLCQGCTDLATSDNEDDRDEVFAAVERRFGPVQLSQYEERSLYLAWDRIRHSQGARQ
jgi:hypothetical protein